MFSTAMPHNTLHQLMKEAGGAVSTRIKQSDIKPRRPLTARVLFVSSCEQEFSETL